MKYEPVDSPIEARVVEGLRALARADSARGPSPAVEAALMAAFDAHDAPAQRRREWVTWLSAAAAVAALAAGLALAQFDLAVSPDLKVGPTESVTDFVLWPGAAALPAFESGELVRMELPASVLPLLGISRADAPAGEFVTADVLYAQDGLARAVRIVKSQSMYP